MCRPGIEKFSKLIQSKKPLIQILQYQSDIENNICWKRVKYHCHILTDLLRIDISDPIMVIYTLNIWNGSFKPYNITV